MLFDYIESRDPSHKKKPTLQQIKSLKEEFALFVCTPILVAGRIDFVFWGIKSFTALKLKKDFESGAKISIAFFVGKENRVDMMKSRGKPIFIENIQSYTPKNMQEVLLWKYVLDKYGTPEKIYNALKESHESIQTTQ